MERQNQLARKRGRKGWGYTLFYAFALCALLLLLCGGFLFFYHSQRLPDFRPLKDPPMNAYSTVYSEEDEVVGKFLMGNRIPVPYERFPKMLVNAFVAAEDAEFFKHKGIDFKGITRAMIKNLMAGRIVQGGSTITQQVTKLFFLTPKRSFLRKLKEAAYAFGLERNLSKEEILTLYLNNIYLGNGAYGVEAAADSYFNKRTDQLNLAEIAMMAGLVKAPSRYSPINSLKRAKERQVYVLTRMTDLGFVSREQNEKAQQTPLKIQSRESAYFSKAPYFTEFIRQLVERKYGKEKLYQEGLRIYTTLDLSLQRTAQKDVEKGIRDLDKRQGFRGPIQTLSLKEMKDLQNKKKGTMNPLHPDEIYEGVILSREDSKKYFTVWVEDRKGILPYAEAAWALRIKATPTYKPQPVKNPRDLLQPGDVVHVKLKDLPTKKDQPPAFSLDQESLVQGALLCLDPKTGYVKAMVGGRDFGESQFNRALHSRRQPGSAFKPLIYAAALEKGYYPSTIIMDSPVEYEDYDEGTYWAPKNYDKNFMGPITFRNALAHSRNVVTVKILEDIGVGYVLKFIKRLGIESPIKRDLSVALGTSGISMLELAQGFGVFANGGERVKPIFIKKIVTLKGEVLEENYPYVELEERDEEGEAEVPSSLLRERVISAQHAFIMTHLLEGVVQHGTGQRAKVLNRPVAGKTGTSSDYTDAWFVGYTPSLLTAVWVGFDDETSLGKDETGARAALPIWIAFMRRTLENSPVEEFEPPAGIVMKKVNLETGLPTEEASQETIIEAFVEGMLPEEKKDEGKEQPPYSPPTGDILPKESPSF